MGEDSALAMDDSVCSIASLGGVSQSMPLPLHPHFVREYFRADKALGHGVFGSDSASKGGCQDAHAQFVKDSEFVCKPACLPKAVQYHTHCGPMCLERVGPRLHGMLARAEIGLTSLVGRAQRAAKVFITCS